MTFHAHGYELVERMKKISCLK